MKLEFRPEALREFEDAAGYYSERQPGLEHRFIVCVEATLQRIGENPGR